MHPETMVEIASSAANESNTERKDRLVRGDEERRLRKAMYSRLCCMSSSPNRVTDVDPG
jgi:hypothetical protein